MRRRGVNGFAGLFFLAGAFACSSSDTNRSCTSAVARCALGDAGDSPDGSTATGGAGGASSASGGSESSGGSGAGGVASGGFVGSGGQIVGAGGLQAGSGGFVGCTSTVVGPGEGVPIDLYVMFDQSSSMGEMVAGTTTTWWQTAAQAMATFVGDPRVASGTVSTGIQYFPLGGVEPASCDVAQYTNPDVEVALLPGNAQAIIDSLGRHGPSTFTPTRPALQGAIDHMTAWAPAHQGHVPAVVFVTDGFPTECDPKDLTDVAAVAQAGFQGPYRIRTYVIGFDAGLGLENLDVIAQAGGTGAAVVIKTGDIGAQFVDAMLGITGVSTGCALDLPIPSTGQVFDVGLFSVFYRPDLSSQSIEIRAIDGAGSCAVNGNDGWYWDDPSVPSQILLCPGTCNRMATGSFQIRYGCTPKAGL